ncbi:MAG: HAD family hydrolase [Phycisphaerales bacterium]|nr:HAD family hydrolase [Phycisphaerales bacterium]
MTTQSARDISWVVFDLGGVIIRIHHSWQLAVAQAGVHGANNFAHDLTQNPMLDPSRHRAAEFRGLVSAQQRGVLAHEDFCKGVSELTTGLVSARDVARIHKSVIVGVYDGVEQLLQDLTARGIVTACLSNTNSQHWQFMGTMPAFAAIQHRHASHLFQLEKPHQAIFAAFERATQARPKDILYFDDVAENIAAATQSGWRAILIDPHSETVPQIRRALATHGVLP